MTETTDPTAAIEVWARMLCAADVHVHGEDHPTWQQLVGEPGSRIRDDYRKAAAWLLPRLTVSAKLPAPADRAAILREAADALVAVAGQHPEARAVVIHWGDAAALLRTMAQEECDELEAQAHLDELADDLSGMADEAQQPETQGDAHPPTVTWEIESPRRDNWASWGATYDEREWARERYESAIENAPGRRFRIVRATTIHTVEDEHTPAAGLPAGGAPHTKEADNPRSVCVCGHTRAEHLTVSGRLLCDACDPDSTSNLVCRGFDAL